MNDKELPSYEQVANLAQQFFDMLDSQYVGVVKPRHDAAEGRSDDSPSQSAYDELMAMIGLEDVKRAVSRELSYHKIMKLRRQMGRKVPRRLMHMLLTGNPGTGKTTCARLIGRIYREAGLLRSGHLIETSRAGLVGQYIGHSEKMVTEKIEAARGGILFIDEIYALVEGSGLQSDNKDFGHRVLDTLMPVLSDPLADVMVIGAGYPSEMQRFLRSNPGLASRFPSAIDFKDFTIDELMQIAHNLLEKYEYRLTPEAEARLDKLLTSARMLENSGNARMVTTLIENHIIPNSCERVFNKAEAELTDEMMSTIVAADIPSLAEIAPLLTTTRRRLGFEQV